MTQFYSDPSREVDIYALPDCEVFYLEEGSGGQDEPSEAGWYYWFCFPGCLPEGDPWGPFETENDAIEACREDNQ